MAGTTEGLGRGSYELAKAPPLLVVSDVHDGLVPYADAVAVFNQARGPKALLTLDWDTSSDSTGSTAHMAASGVVGPTSAEVVKSTTAFFNAFLKHEHGALQAVARQRSIFSVGGAHRLDFGFPSNLASPQGSCGPPARRRHSKHGLAGRPGRYRSMEWLYARQGRQYPRVFPSGYHHGQLGGLQLRPCSPSCTLTPRDRAR